MYGLVFKKEFNEWEKSSLSLELFNEELYHLVMMDEKPDFMISIGKDISKKIGSILMLAILDSNKEIIELTEKLGKK